MSHEISEALRRLVAERAYRVCEYCLVHEREAYHAGEVDHIIIQLKHWRAYGNDSFSSEMMVRKAVESQPHLVNLPFGPRLGRGRQLIEAFVKLPIVKLKPRAHEPGIGWRVRARSPAAISRSDCSISA